MEFRITAAIDVLPARVGARDPTPDIFSTGVGTIRSGTATATDDAPGFWQRLVASGRTKLRRLWAQYVASRSYPFSSHAVIDINFKRLVHVPGDINPPVTSPKGEGFAELRAFEPIQRSVPCRYIFAKPDRMRSPAQRSRIAGSWKEYPSRHVCTLMVGLNLIIFRTSAHASARR